MPAVLAVQLMSDASERIQHAVQQTGAVACVVVHTKENTTVKTDGFATVDDACDFIGEYMDHYPNITLYLTNKEFQEHREDFLYLFNN